MSDHETAGAELVPAKRKNLPMRILRAFDNAKHLVGLKRGVKDTLAELCRFIPQNRPFETIFAHKATIAARIGASERTIYRHLQALQEHRLIDVLEQDRKSRNGRFTVARIRLTRKAAVLLGMIDAPEEIARLDDGALTDMTPAIAQDAAYTFRAAGALKPEGEGLIPSAPSAKMTAGHTLSVPTISKNQPPQRTKNGLPIDLAWMTGNGLSRAGVFKLMGTAKAHGKRLSDIAIVVHEYIQDLKGGRLYAYLAKLAAGPTDFAVAAANERKRLADAEKARAFERKTQVFRTRFGNTALTDRNQTRLYLIDRQAHFVQVLGGPRPGTAPLNDLAPWIKGVETGELVLATLDTERRLQASAAQQGPTINPELSGFDTGYWRFTPSGVPAPGFLFDLLTEPQHKERFALRLEQFGRDTSLVPFALELEHRSAPITTVRHLEEALARIADVSYAFTAAKALQQQCAEAVEEINQRTVDQRRRQQAHSDEAKFLREIAQQALPRRPNENLALIRSLLAPHRYKVGTST